MLIALGKHTPGALLLARTFKNDKGSDKIWSIDISLDLGGSYVIWYFHGI